jgi:hypothetical protein
MAAGVLTERETEVILEERESLKDPTASSDAGGFSVRR